MNTFESKLKIRASSKVEAKQKAKALNRMQQLLDGRTLEALATHLPAILSDPVESQLIKNRLGL